MSNRKKRRKEAARMRSVRKTLDVKKRSLFEAMEIAVDEHEDTHAIIEKVSDAIIADPEMREIVAGPTAIGENTTADAHLAHLINDAAGGVMEHAVDKLLKDYGESQGLEEAGTKERAVINSYFNQIVAARVGDKVRQKLNMPDLPMSTNRMKHHVKDALTRYDDAVKKGEWPLPKDADLDEQITLPNAATLLGEDPASAVSKGWLTQSGPDSYDLTQIGAAVLRQRLDTIPVEQREAASNDLEEARVLLKAGKGEEAEAVVRRLEERMLGSASPMAPLGAFNGSILRATADETRVFRGAASSRGMVDQIAREAAATATPFPGEAIDHIQRGTTVGGNVFRSGGDTIVRNINRMEEVLGIGEASPRQPSALGAGMRDHTGRESIDRTLKQIDKSTGEPFTSPLGTSDPWWREWARRHPDAAKMLGDSTEQTVREEAAVLAAQGKMKGVTRPPGWGTAFSGLADDWSDSSLMQVGFLAWHDYRRRPGVDLDEALALCESDIKDIYAHEVEAGNGPKCRTALRFATFALAWAEHAFQKIVTTHTFAAALMCSDATHEAVEDIHIQWKAFMVVVPNGMLAIDALPDGRSGADFTRILIHVQDDGVAHIMIYDPSAAEHRQRVMSNSNATLADLLYSTPDQFLDSSGRRKPGDIEQRVLKMAKRLVIGLLLSLQHQDNFKTRSVAPRYGKKSREVEEPAHRITTVGRPLKVDARGAVARYLQNADGGGRKKGMPPSMQVLVRGHFKRQVMGVARSLRKTIWVEPYWRGPEDAPILTRPKLIGSTS